MSAVTSDEIGYLDGVSSSIQTQLDGKEPTINLTSSKVAVSDGSGGLTASSLNSSNLDYLDITTLGTTEASKVVTSNSSNIINLASNSFINMPTQLSNFANGNYVVNKEYVDSVAEGLHILEPCLVASFSNYVPNTSGSGIGYDHVKMGQGSRLEIDLELFYYNWVMDYHL